LLRNAGWGTSSSLLVKACISLKEEEIESAHCTIALSGLPKDG
jgi:hypothetical protein